MEERSVQYGTTKLWYTLVRTDRRTLGFVVHPDARVELRAPQETAATKVDEQVLRKARWIVRQQDFFRAFLPAAPAKEYVSGESHRYLGRQFRLKVNSTADAEHVKLSGGRIHIHTHHPKDADHVRGLLAGWYRSHAVARFDVAVNKAMPLFKKHGIARPSVRVQRLRKRWGSCTAKGTILLNPDLIQAPGHCIDYVVVHELCHLVHPDHSSAFYKLLDRTMPEWKKWKGRLEAGV
jgi:predicted metal-dependent hydrolase